MNGPVICTDTCPVTTSAASEIWSERLRRPHRLQQAMVLPSRTGEESVNKADSLCIHVASAEWEKMHIPTQFLHWGSGKWFLTFSLQ